MRGQTVIVIAFVLFVMLARATEQQPPPPQTAPDQTRPPANNDQSLRVLSPDEIPPNLSFYAIDPLYKPGASLGWAAVRIREPLDRGLVAVATKDGRGHLSWRLLETDPPTVAFNVYRSVAQGAETKLNLTPIRTTTDFVDRPPVGAARWRVAAVVGDREETVSTGASWSDPPIQGYRSMKLRDDVTSVDRVGSAISTVTVPTTSSSSIP